MLSPVTISSIVKALAACLEDLLSLGVAPELCRELQEKLRSDTFDLIVVGEFKRGKSTLINALIGAELLPVGVVPLTSIITTVRYGDAISIQVVYEDGAKQEITAGQLADYVTEKGNPRNTKGVREVVISHPSSWLKGGVRIVDTPGIGSIYEHNTELAHRFLAKADAALFMLSADQPVSETERNFLKRVAEHASRMFFLLNKADLLGLHELQEVIVFSQRALAEAMGSTVPLFALSARAALRGKLEGSQDLLRQSRLPEFFQALDQFFVKEKNKVLTASIARNALRVVSQARLSGEIELKAHAVPLAELREKMQAFERKKQEASVARKEHGLLLDGEVRELLKQTVETDLEKFNAQLAWELAASVDRCFNEHRALPSSRLREVLEQHVIAEIRNAFDRWRPDEDEKVSTAFRGLCTRLAARVDDMIDALFRYSSELFAIPFDAVKAESSWRDESGFYYKFWSEPVSLQILASSAILALPKVIGDRLLLRQAKKFAAETVDTQAGRVRYDFAQRLDKSAREFKVRILQRIDVTIEGIENAMQKGTAISRANAVEFEQINTALSAKTRKLDEIRGRLVAVMESTGAGIG